MTKKNNITGIILSGGNSIRMGSDKGLLNYNNKSFIDHIKNAMLPLVNDVMLISNHKAHQVFHLKRHEDLIPGAGPLAGLYTGLYYSKTEYNLVLSCDVPLITTPILKKLVDNIDGSDIVMFQTDDRINPLVALYRRSSKSILSELLQKGERRVQTAIRHLKVKTILLGETDWKFLANVNTKEELKKIISYD